MQTFTHFKEPLAVDELITKLVPLKKFLLALLEDSHYFTLWANDKGLHKLLPLVQQFKKILRNKPPLKLLFKNIERVEEQQQLTQALLKDLSLRRFLFDNHHYLSKVAKLWYNNPNVFFDEQDDQDSDKPLGLFGLPSENPQEGTSSTGISSFFNSGLS